MRRQLHRLTEPLHDALLDRSRRYRTWHEYRNHRKIHYGIALVTLIFAFGVCIQNFRTAVPVYAVAGETSYSAVNTKLAGDDSAAGPFPIGFTFPFFGVDKTQLYMQTNGTLNFDAGNSSYWNDGVTLPDTDVMPNGILAFWDDLITQDYSAQTLYYQTVGTAPNRKFIAQWKNMYFYSNPDIPLGTFQIILYENSGAIQLQYRDLLGGALSHGSSATVGITNGTVADIYSQDTESLTEGQAIRFTPNGSGDYTMNSAAAYDPVYLVLDTVPLPPTITSPGDTATGISPTPTFTWLPANLATSYRLVIATDSNFTEGLINVPGITDTQYSLGSSLSYATTYYWRIEAINGSGSNFSDTFRFTTGSAPNHAPDSPSSLGPAHFYTDTSFTQAALTAEPFTFTLHDTDGSDTNRYRIQFSAATDFSTLALDYQSGLQAQGATSFTLGQAAGSGNYLTGSADTVLTPGQTYSVRFRAYDNSGSASDWVNRTSAFVVSAAAPSPTPTPTPTPTATLTPTPAPQSTPTATPTATPILATASPTPTPVVSPSLTSTPSPSSSTPTVSPHASPSPTLTPSPSPTPVASPSPTPLIALSSPSPLPPTLTRTGTTITIVVLNNQHQPVVNALVTLHSNPMTAYTNAQGRATFTDVPSGAHTAEVHYDGQVATTKLAVADTVQTLNVNLTLQKSTPQSWWWLYISIGCALLASLCGFLLFGNKKKRRKFKKFFHS